MPKGRHRPVNVEPLTLSLARGFFLVMSETMGTCRTNQLFISSLQRNRSRLVQLDSATLVDFSESPNPKHEF